MSPADTVIDFTVAWNERPRMLRSRNSDYGIIEVLWFVAVGHGKTCFDVVLFQMLPHPPSEHRRTLVAIARLEVSAM